MAVWLGGAAVTRSLTTINFYWGATSVTEGGYVRLTINSKNVDVYLAHKFNNTTFNAAVKESIVDQLVAVLNGGEPTWYEEDANNYARVTATVIDDGLPGPFRDITAQAYESNEYFETAGTDTARVQMLGPSNGAPLVITITDGSTSADFTISESPAATAGSGPEDFNTATNWDTGSVPSSGTIIFDHRAVNSVKYNLDAKSGSTYTLVYVSEGFQYEIGLPTWNEAGYPEYRARALTAGMTTARINGGSGMMYLNAGSVQTTLVLDRPVIGSEIAPTVQWRGTHASNVVNVDRGDVGIAWERDLTAVVATLRIGNQGAPASDAVVAVGAGTTLTTVTMNGGLVVCPVNVTTLTIADGEISIREAATLTTLWGYGGTVNYESSGTLTTASIYAGCLLDFGRSELPRTVTNCTLTRGAGYIDPLGTVTHTNGIDLYGCRPDELSVFTTPKHRTYSLSTI